MLFEPVRAAARAVSKQLPNPMQRALLVQRRLRYWREARIVFIHVPKAAGTSINLALYGRYMGHVSAGDIERWAPQEVAAMPRFAVVRNPWGRLLSAYRFVRLGRGIGGYEGSVAHPEIYRGAQCKTFERFVLEWLPTCNLSAADAAFHPQWRYVGSEDGRLLVDRLGRFEDIEPFVSEMVPGVKLSRANTSGPQVDYRAFYTPEMIDLVSRIYAEDISRFGYTFGN